MTEPAARRYDVVVVGGRVAGCAMGVHLARAGLSVAIVEREPGSLRNVMLHDGSWVRLRKIAEDYNPTDRDRAYSYIRERQKEGEVVTGLLYIQPDSSDLHEQSNTVAQPLVSLPYETLCPGSAELEKLQARFR